MSRGRRPDPGPPAVAFSSGNGQATIAWLLRVNRIYGADENLATAARFARAFNAGADGLSASESQISRWEHASVAAGRPVLQRYEQLLCLPSGQILAVAHTLYRESLDRLGPPSLPHRSTVDDQRQLHDLLDHALGGGLMSGQDWEQLTGLLWGQPVFLHPVTLWQQLAQRLLDELLISEGRAWLYRCEAINRLLGHQHGTRPVIDSCAAVIEDPRSQVLIEPMALLELTPEPAAATHLMRQIGQPSGRPALRAAWWAVAEKAARGHFSAAQADVLVNAAADTLEDTAALVTARMSAAETLRQLFPTATGKARQALARLSRTDPVTANVVQHGIACPHETVYAMVRRLAAATLAGMPREVLRHDPALERLIAEMLFHPQGTRRTVAAQAIAATPYRPGLAAAIGQELTRGASLSDPVLATILVQALAHLGGPAQAPLVQRLATGWTLPPPVREAAAWVVGHLRDTRESPFWEQITRWLVQEACDDRPLPESYAKGLVYSLGTARRRDCLTRLATAVGLHHDLRVAAAWWLSLPELIQLSSLL